jgi:hypothetical protein
MPTLKDLESLAQTTLSEDLVVWKKANYHHKKETRRCLVELKVPKRAKVNICTGNHVDHRKCRSSSAHVLSATCLATGKKLNKEVEIFSDYDPTFIYLVGQKIKPIKKFNTNAVKCASGIHFFLRMKDATKYNFL